MPYYILDRTIENHKIDYFLFLVSFSGLFGYSHQMKNK
jgi:hypothetical protein